MRNPACRRLAFPALPCLLFLLLTPLAGASLSAGPLFQDPLYQDLVNPGGQDPVAVVAADFNGDRRIDLAMLNATTGIVFFLRDQRGDYYVMPWPSGIALSRYSFVTAMTTADFDHDGKADLAILDDEDDKVTLYIGSGNGTFVPGALYDTGQGPIAVVAADFNGDGVEDLAVANRDSGDVSIILRTGDGTYRPPLRFPTGGSPGSLAALDFNKDGHPDLAVAV